MGRFGTEAAATLVVFLLAMMLALPGRAAPLIIAQATTPATPVATPSPSPAPEATSSPSPSQAAAAPGAPTPALAKKSAISVPACSVRYLEAKVAGKLNGKKWADFRRDECGATETTAVFPTTISPKYSGEKDVDKARRMTCADQFTANKATKANGGLKWIEKDGGYYGECISRLKG
jgi:hypothetical protein